MFKINYSGLLMNLTEKLIEMSLSFPEIGITSGSLEKCENRINGLRSKRFLALATAIAVLFFILTVLVAFIAYSQMIIISIAIGLLIFAMIFLSILKLPQLEISKRNIEMEHQLPFLLREIALLLDLGLPFERAVMVVSKKNDRLGNELKKALISVERGITMQRALLDFASVMTSTNVKRSITQLVSIYESGGSGDGIRKIADDLLNIEQNRFKQESSKTAIYGMIFVTVCAVVPTFIAVLSLSNSAMLGETISFSREQIATVLLILVPSLGFLLVLKVKMQNNNNIRESVIDKEDIYLFLASVSLAIVSMVTTDKLVIYTAIAVISALLLIVFYRQRMKDKKVEGIERALPDALLAISNLPTGSRIERIFENMKPFGELGKEVGITLKQIKSNVKPEDALEQLARRNDSVLLKQTCASLAIAINTGKLDKLSYVGEYIMKILEIKRERSSMLSMQKYTIYLGALITPLVIKMTLSLVKSFQESMGITLSENGIESIMPAYIIIYSAISSYYLSSIEEEKSTKMINFVAMTIVGLVILMIMR